MQLPKLENKEKQNKSTKLTKEKSANTTGQRHTGLDQMDPTEYHGKGNNQKTTSPSWEENVQAERSHTSMKIPLDLEHS